MAPDPTSADRRSSGRQLLLFAAVGTAGFVVDTAALYVAVLAWDMGLYVGRLFSYLAAATFTWWANRRYTFSGQATGQPLREWFRFLAANTVGGVVNYATYAGLLVASTTVMRWPVVGVAAGSIAGLAVNYTLSRRLVFTGRKHMPLGN